MSLARSFTTRRAKLFGSGDSEDKPTRSLTVKKSATGSVRSKISGPIELISTTNNLSYRAPDIRKGPMPKISAPVELVYTTNMLSYDAPDIQKEPKTATSQSSLSIGSDGDSDQTPSARSSPPTSPDTASPLGSDKEDESPSVGPNHLSCYFTLPNPPSTANAPDVPAIPSRSLSHQKSSPERLGRKTSMAERVGRKTSMSRLSDHSNQSLSNKQSATFSRASSASTNTTASHQSAGGYHAKTSSIPPARPLPSTPLATPPAVQQHKEPAAKTESHPFGHELAQVTELAEEYATTAASKLRSNTTEEDRELAYRGLKKFGAEDYISEIQGLFSTFFSDVRHAKAPIAQAWI